MTAPTRTQRLAERERALAAGLEVLEWPLDPFDQTQCTLVVGELGATARRYRQHDHRLLVEWLIASAHVQRRLAASGSGRLTIRSHAALVAPAINDVVHDGQWLTCGPVLLDVGAERAWVQVPLRFNALEADAPALAGDWRSRLALVFTHWFAAGYRAVDYQVSSKMGLGRFLLARQE
ncbi:MAG: hypothetical protein HOP14_00670 [Acidobacteria bacterium]|nr:hypothetical protein [Acidobacteriota bacterium]